MLLSIDDGCASDVRVASLAKKYNIQTIFYWPVEWHSLAYDNGYEPLSYQEALDISKEFEIGSHTITHRHLTRVHLQDALREIIESKKILEKIFDTTITRFCPPRGYTNQQLDEFILTTYEGQRLTKGEGLVHIHPDSGANHNIPWREYANSIDVKEIWGHSWEFDKFDLWGQLEEFLSENSRR